MRRTGLSRSSWVTTAILEKLERDARDAPPSSLIVDAITATIDAEPDDAVAMVFDLRHDGTISAAFAEDRSHRLTDLVEVHARPDGEGSVVIELIGLPGTDEDCDALRVAALPAGLDLRLTIGLVDLDPELREVPA